MTVSTLDTNPALILVDLQRGVIAVTEHNGARVALNYASELAKAFRRRRLPVVLVNVDGMPPGRTNRASVLSSPPPDWTDLAAELAPQPSDIRITKQSWGAFTGTGLEEILRRRSVTQLVIAGISASIGVETTARQAYELGFNVVLVVDAMSDTNPEAQSNSITRIFPRLGETGMTADILALLPPFES